MITGVTLFTSLFHNLALFIALVAVYGALSSTLPRMQSIRRQLALGAVFGLFAFACMHALIPVAPGVRVDQRNAVVALSGAFGGPVAALITGGVAAGYRVYLGGKGVLSGVTGVALSVLAGLILHRAEQPFGSATRSAVAAFLATLLILPGFALYGSWSEGATLLVRMAVPYGTAIFLAVMLGGLLLNREDRRREAVQRFQAMVALAPDAILVFDRGRRIRFLNAQGEHLCAKGARSVLGRPVGELGWLGEELGARLSRAEGPRERMGPFEIDDPCGERVLEATMAPVFSGTGEEEWMTIVRDVTARKRAEELRADYEARILQSKSLESLGRLAGGVAHDFNNMLAVILGTTEILRAQRAAGEGLQEDLDNITVAATRASELTAQLLAFGRRQVLEPQVLDPNEVVRALVPLLKRSLPESIELVVSLGTSVPSVLVDAVQLDQVLVNLAVNARDAMPQGGTLTIGTSLRELGEDDSAEHSGAVPGRYVVISVSDTGSGMTPEVRDHVFEPFFTTKERGKGTGLGLATVYGIVSQSGGHVHVSSEPGKGSCFSVFFPTTQHRPVEADRPERHPVPFSGHVLLVEDSDLVRVPIRRMLVSLGFEVTEAGGGREAITACLRAQRPFDLLVTDVVMRDLGGPEVAAEVRKYAPGLKVLFMSGYTENAFAQEGVLDAGVNFIPKPFTLDRLRAALERVLVADVGPQAKG